MHIALYFHWLPLPPFLSPYSHGPVHLFVNFTVLLLPQLLQKIISYFYFINGNNRKDDYTGFSFFFLSASSISRS